MKIEKCLLMKELLIPSIYIESFLFQARSLQNLHDVTLNLHPFAINLLCIQGLMFFASTVVVVVSIIRIMLFWLKNYENIILNTYKKLKNWSIVVLLFTLLVVIT